MNPTITSLSEENNILNFTIKDINISLANGLRRVIISEIPTVVFQTFPYSENKATIEINTSRFNNEIIKQRLGCIPIHINDKDFPIKEYIVEIDVVNTTANILYVTTKDFKIKNIATGQYLSESIRDQIFPSNKITNNYIDFLRLKPALNEKILGEQIKLSCLFSSAIAKDNGMYNIVSTCSYGGSLDQEMINKKWKEKEQELKAEKSSDELDIIKKDWLLLDAKRYTIPNSFDFIIETIGIYTNYEICYKACEIIINKIKTFMGIIQTEKIIKPALNVMDNCYDIILNNEDYTLGKIIEYILYENNFNKELTFCGFKKPHPHLNYSLIRVAFKDEIEDVGIISLFLTACQTGIEIFDNLKENFSS